MHNLNWSFVDVNTCARKNLHNATKRVFTAIKFVFICLWIKNSTTMLAFLIFLCSACSQIRHTDAFTAVQPTPPFIIVHNYWEQLGASVHAFLDILLVCRDQNMTLVEPYVGHDREHSHSAINAFPQQGVLTGHASPLSGIFSLEKLLSNECCPDGRLIAMQEFAAALPPQPTAVVLHVDYADRSRPMTLCAGDDSIFKEKAGNPLQQDLGFLFRELVHYCLGADDLIRQLKRAPQLIGSHHAMIIDTWRGMEPKHKSQYRVPYNAGEFTLKRPDAGQCLVPADFITATAHDIVAKLRSPVLGVHIRFERLIKGMIQAVHAANNLQASDHAIRDVAQCIQDIGRAIATKASETRSASIVIVSDLGQSGSGTNGMRSVGFETAFQSHIGASLNEFISTHVLQKVNATELDAATHDGRGSAFANRVAVALLDMSVLSHADSLMYFADSALHKFVRDKSGAMAQADKFHRCPL